MKFFSLVIKQLQRKCIFFPKKVDFHFEMSEKKSTLRVGKRKRFGFQKRLEMSELEKIGLFILRTENQKSSEIWKKRQTDNKIYPSPAALRNDNRGHRKNEKPK